MTSSDKFESKHRGTHATEADIVRVVDGPATADYEASDMAHAVADAQNHHRKHAGGTAPSASGDGVSK